MTPFQPRDRVHLKGHPHTPHTTGTVRSIDDQGVHVLWDDGEVVTPQVPTHLEPLGEPMQTKLKSLTSFDSSLTFGPNGLGILVGIMREGETVQATTIAKSSAPDGAIAFLQSAVPVGEPIPAEFARAMEALEEYKQRIQIEAEDAADRDKLEAEALELLNAAREADDNLPMDSLDETRPGTKERWIATAKCARVLYGVTK